MRSFLLIALVACLALVGVGCGIGSSGDASLGQPNLLDPASLVLSPADVGAGYAQNGPATHPVPVSENQQSGRFGARLRREFIAGYAAGYPGTSAQEAVVGIWSGAKVFKTSLGSWYTPAAREYFKHHRQGLLPMPAAAPGTPLSLWVQDNVRVAGYTVTLVAYTWAEGRVASTVTVSGRPGDPTKLLVAALMRLAKIQDTKIRMAS